MKCKIGGQTVELEIEGRISGDGARGARTPLGREMGEPRTKDRQGNQSTEGQGNVKSGDRTLHPTNPYRSKLEAQYAQHLDLLKRAGEIVAWWYEPVRFRLPGTRNFYKGDFLIQNGCKPLRGSVAGQHAGIEIHEVKGWSKNRREGITKLKTAAGLNTWATFYLVRWDENRQQWDKKLVQV